MSDQSGRTPSSIGAQDMGSYAILTPRSWHSSECRGDCLADRLDRVLRLHREEYDRICTTCRETWPCDTWKAISDDF